MDKNEILNRVQQILADQVGLHDDEDMPTDEIRLIEDLGCDSLDTVEIVMAIEEEFDLEIPDEDAEKCQTVGQVVELILNMQ